MTGGQLRVGDSDREAAVTALGDHYAAGRLTKDEFDERAGSAWGARTTAELTALFADLPWPGASQPSPAVPAVPAAPVFRRQRPGWLTPLLVVLVGLTVLTHLPLFLLVVVVWLVLARGHRRGPWVGPHAGGPHGPHAGRWTGR